MSKLVPENKVKAIESLGADVRIIGQSQDEAEVEAVRLAKEEGMIPIPPFDHLHVIAGQGMIGLELRWHSRRYLQNSGDRSDYGKRCSHETQLGSRETGSGY